MGICLSIVRVKDATIDEICASPKKLVHFWLQDDSPEPAPVGLIGRLFGKKKSEVPKCTATRVDGDETDVDKAWDAIDYLISEKRTKLGLARFITEGGTEIHEDVGYGGARAYYSRDVKKISDLLNEIDLKVLRRSYEPREMDNSDVYPQFYVRGGDDIFDYVSTNFLSLKAFLHESASQNEGVLLIFT